MKKRMFCLFLAAAMLLAGCGNSQAQVGGDLKPIETTPETTAAATQPEENTVSMGVLDGGVYTNAYAGFGVELDSEWSVMPAEMLQDLPDNVREMFKGTELEDVKLTQFTDVMAENANLLVNFNVLYQKLGMKDRLAYAVMSEEQILDSVLAMSDTLVDAYANAGIAVESVEKKNISFLGEDRVAMYTVASVQGIPYYILQLYYYNLGAYSVTLTVGSFVEDNSQSVLELFYALEQ